jgi:hypothetical protein
MPQQDRVQGQQYSPSPQANYGRISDLWSQRAQRGGFQPAQFPTMQRFPRFNVQRSDPFHVANPMQANRRVQDAIHYQGGQVQPPGPQALFGPGERYYKTVSPFSFTRQPSQESNLDAGVYGNTYPDTHPVMLHAADPNYEPGYAGQRAAQGYTPWWRKPFNTGYRDYAK